jgi:hypothetical protein
MPKAGWHYTPKPNQSGDGYKCTCGFITDNRFKLLSHLRFGQQKDGKEAHQTAGRCNLQTGEITMPPYLERTPDQLDETKYGKKAQKVNPDGKITTVRTTEVLAQATEVRFIPRIFSCTYTPIMQAALAAAVNVFHWRQNMPFENFLDTVIYYFFFEHGVQLAGYIVDDSIINQGDGGSEGKTPTKSNDHPKIVSVELASQ